MISNGNNGDKHLECQWPWVSGEMCPLISSLFNTLIKLIVSVVLFLILGSCDSSQSYLSQEISRQFQATGRTFVNLVEVLPAMWDRVCIFGPYSNDKAAKDTLTFHWDLESKSSITHNDSIGLLVFVQGEQVVEFVEHARRDGDFTNLSRQCFAREKSTFHHQTNPQKGWPGLFPNK